MIFRLLARPYVLALAAPLLVVTVTMLLRALLPPAPPGHIASPLFLLVILISAWYGNCWTGLLTAVLAFFALEFLYVPPFYALHLGWEDMPRVLVFVLASLVVSTLNMLRHRAQHALDETAFEMRAARDIQQRLFPAAPPVLANLEVAGATYPAEATGGDYYDFIPMRAGKLGIVLGDVSGHGFASALLMAETRAYIRALAQSHDNVGDIVTFANRLLSEDTADDRFVTLFFACIDPAAGSMVYAGAGHEAFLIGPQGDTTKLPSTGMPLGVDAAAVIALSPVIQVQSGAILLMVSDGVLETQSASGTSFGLHKAIEVISAAGSSSCRDAVESLHQSVRAFAQHQKQLDDVTIVIVKAKPASSTE